MVPGKKASRSSFRSVSSISAAAEPSSFLHHLPSCVNGNAQPITDFYLFIKEGKLRGKCLKLLPSGLTYYSPTTLLSPFLLYCTFLVSLCITVFMGYCTLYEEKPLSHFHINLPYYTNFKDEQVICQIGMEVHVFFEKITSTSDKDTVVVMGFNWFTVKLTNYKLCTGHHI